MTPEEYWKLRCLVKVRDEETNSLRTPDISPENYQILRNQQTIFLLLTSLLTEVFWIKAKL